MKPKKKKQEKELDKAEHCLLCKTFTKEGAFTSDGEIVCDCCCEWIVKESVYDN